MSKATAETLSAEEQSAIIARRLSSQHFNTAYMSWVSVLIAAPHIANTDAFKKWVNDNKQTIERRPERSGIALNL